MKIVVKRGPVLRDIRQCMDIRRISESQEQGINQYSKKNSTTWFRLPKEGI